VTYDEAVEAVGKELYGDYLDSGNRLRLNIERLNAKGVELATGRARTDRGRWMENFRERKYLHDRIWQKVDT